MICVTYKSVRMQPSFMYRNVLSTYTIFNSTIYIAVNNIVSTHVVLTQKIRMNQVLPILHVLKNK